MDAAAQQSTAAPVGPNLSIDRFIEGSITCLRFQGTIDESFDGKRLAATIKASTLIFDLGSVKRISSFGIREWTDFIRMVERSVDRIIAIECTPKVVDQLNMVRQFLGSRGQVFSFYAPYRCDYCDLDRRVLFQVNRDQAAIREMRPPEQLCETCSRPSYFDEEPASFFANLAVQPPFELDPSIAEFLSSKLRYSVTGGDRRLHVDKHVDGRNTYLKFVGNLDGSFPSNKIAEGLEGQVVVEVSGIGTIDLAGAAEWRNFITQAKSQAEKVFVVGCPPILLERLTRQGDLGDQVISFTMPYSCSKCATTASQSIDVEQHYDILKFATPPEMKCAHCKSPTVCVAPESLLSRLRTLPKVEIDQGLRKFLREMRDRKPEKPKGPGRAAPVTGARMGMFAGVAGVAGVAVVALVGVNYFQQRETRETQNKLESVINKVSDNQHTSVPRPGWITSDTPVSAYCTDNVTRLSCVGISPYLPSRDNARLDAVNAALEEAVNSVALKIDSKEFDQKVRTAFEASRAKALQDLDVAMGAPKGAAYAKAIEAVRIARRSVAEALLATGGAAVPVQHAAWYWEAYDSLDKPGATEYLVFVRYDFSFDAVKALVEEYSMPTEVQGSRVVTAFPALAWRFPSLKQGAFVVESRGRLKTMGVADQSVITAAAGDPVRTAAELATKVKGKGRDLKLTVQGPDGAIQQL